MKFNARQPELDAIDLHIVQLLQEHCRMPLSRIGDQVGLSAPAVMERIKKLEDAGVITGYVATLDARKLGLDVTAFIGVSVSTPRAIGAFEKAVNALPEVLECHHVTGTYTVLLKVKTKNTAALEMLIRRLRGIRGVSRTETMVVLSTATERTQLALEIPNGAAPSGRRLRRDGERSAASP